MSLPLVSVICLCYNHASYVRQAALSVMNQTYTNIQLIIVDDASTDSSREVVKVLQLKFPTIQIINNEVNLGNCKAFNKGFQLAQGKYIIDLAADDILLPERIAKGVADLESRGVGFGVNFCDTWLVDLDAGRLRTHFKRIAEGKLVESVPQGDVYREVVRRYFISAPTMLIRKTVLDSLGGYDAALTYEDFDFWVRSSRDWKYSYTDEVLVEKRILPGSLSSKQFQKGSQHEWTTLQVIQKAFLLNRNRGDHFALAARTAYELRKSITRGDFSLAWQYAKLMAKLMAAMFF